jgi:large conductance mechanosensitive channel
MKILQEFKAFAMRGNVLDLAVAVIIGAAFGKIVTSFVNDILMPPLGVLMGGLDFKDYVWVMIQATGDKPAVTLNYGMFIQNIIDFLIIAASIFLLIRALSHLKKKPEPEVAAPAPPTKDQQLLEEIRDILKAKN